MSMPEMLRNRLLHEVEIRVRNGFTFHNLRHASEVHLAVCQILSHYPEVESKHALEFEAAAILHDIAYCEGAEGHEQRGSKLSVHILRNVGIPEDVANRVGELIKYTSIAAEPLTLEAKIMRDADVFHIGVECGRERSLDLWQELRNSGREIGREEWYRSEIRYLRQQHFFLGWLEAERASGRAAAIRALEAAIGRQS